jgi:hypothetical protein
LNRSPQPQLGGNFALVMRWTYVECLELIVVTYGALEWRKIVDSCVIFWTQVSILGVDVWKPYDITGSSTVPTLGRRDNVIGAELDVYARWRR